MDLTSKFEAGWTVGNCKLNIMRFFFLLEHCDFKSFVMKYELYLTFITTVFIQDFFVNCQDIQYIIVQRNDGNVANFAF